MTTYLTIEEDILKQKKAYWTAKEIAQQPRVWQEAQQTVQDNQAELNAFLTPILAIANLRIILTGAGTSAYIGDAVAPHLSAVNGRLFEAISTTDLVSNPNQNLLKHVPTLLISYGRSGNSPESVGAVEIADQVLDSCYHLVLTCNPKGELAESAEKNPKAFSLLMPEGTLDESFAMTSSYSSMLVSTLCIFSPDTKQLNMAINTTENLLANSIDAIKEQAKNGCDRLVFLGCGSLLGIAREAALKCLELTAGSVLSYCESPLGFRHGPKSLVTDRTEIILLSSSDKYSKGYDDDLWNELVRDDAALSVFRLDSQSFGQNMDLDDIWAGLPYIVYCQILSFFKSVDLDISPDNPCPSGEVNRVVQGVTIYPLAS
ncbi:SIS domain-containing protein [Thalassotalea fonticola]|uniref:SIS domain-containing protein n=1 Tax=Thalassotalea fonticola TaxID=3065649 RepID=A0ABZ0GL26_9GAMM|nr:SIS domain-containing protein [Colwelliaceae bacterium S1-1]